MTCDLFVCHLQEHLQQVNSEFKNSKWLKYLRVITNNRQKQIVIKKI